MHQGAAKAPAQRGVVGRSIVADIAKLSWAGRTTTSARSPRTAKTTCLATESHQAR
jgi:hypothetical protein